MFEEILGVLGVSILGVLAILAGIALIPIILIALVYNTFISKRNRVGNAFASVDVMLKKRYDLIPNLVAAVEGYMKHEKGVLTEVTELRAKAISGKMTDDEKIDLNNRITGALRTIMVSVENYPQLKANENFLHLQASLNELEEQISAARRAYNASVLEYNNAVDMFPTNIFGGLMGFKRREFFQASDEERKVPQAPKTLSK